MKRLVAIVLFLVLCAVAQQMDINSQTKNILKPDRIITGTILPNGYVKASSDGTQLITSTGPTGGGTAITGLPELQNGAPDQTGYSFYTVSGLTAWKVGHWEYLPGQTSSVYFSMRLPHVVTSATVVLEVFSADSTAGHTANFTINDGVVDSGQSMNLSALTPGTAQAYTTSAIAYARQTIAFPVQSTLVTDGELLIEVKCSPVGTQPTSNIQMLAYLQLS